MLRFRLTALALSLALVAASCGSRTGLLSPEVHPKSTAFCARAGYESGHSDVTILVLLDASYSMADNGKWDDATAAVAALVHDADAAGMGFGLDYLPDDGAADCSIASYESMAVPVAILPANADQVVKSLAAHKPEGITPTYPGLRGAVVYARTLRLADPKRDVVVAIVTDGDPEGCADLPNSVAGVAALAEQSATTSPEVRTYVVGLASGLVANMDEIAAAGGTGKAILVGSDPTTAQLLVTTLKSLRDDDRVCRYAIPDVVATPSPYDLAVSLAATPSSPPADVPLVGAAPQCGGAPGFYVDDPNKPTRLTLCPASCALAHDSPDSRVSITVGCGAGAKDGGVDFDAGPCPSVIDTACKLSCESSTFVDAVCVQGQWACPQGSVSLSSCSICPPVPHGCCKADGSLGAASCVAGAWVCPPGALFFGDPGCRPPEACGPSLPCAPGSVCRAPDSLCASSTATGTCVTPPPSCPAGDAACGCDGKTYASECAANAAGVDVSVQGCVAPSPSTFACGPYYCDRASELCEETLDLKKAVAQKSFKCVSAAGCATGCDCHACGASCKSPSCTEVCGNDGAGGRQVTCTLL